MHYSARGDFHRFETTNAKLLVYSCTTLMDVANVGADSGNKIRRFASHRWVLTLIAIPSSHFSLLIIPSKMFSKQVVLVVAAAVASVTSQTTTSTTCAAPAPTEVTDCHAHGENEFFCFDADNEEWELASSGFSADNLPEAFTGCHMHDEEL
jgi:hypothetical protein